MRIALCAIVKDEEEVLERMIESFKPIVDRFVIFDTGSTDSTKEIIQKYGKLYEYKFTDFVETKNKVLEEVSKMEDIDYVLWADADEYCIENLQKLKIIIETRPNLDYVDTEIVDLNTLNGDPTIRYIRKRIWKNINFDKGWKFHGPGIHEYMHVPSENGIIDRSIVIAHRHKLRGKDYWTRHKFYIDILKGAVTKNKDDSRGWFYLARTYKDVAYFKEAIETYNEYFKSCDRINYHFIDEEYQALLDIAHSYKGLQKLDDAIKSYISASELSNKRAEAFFELGKIYFTEETVKDLSKAKYYAEIALSKDVPNDVNLFLEPKFYYEFPLDLLAYICWEAKNYTDGLKYINMLIESKNIDDNKKNISLQNKIFFEKMINNRTQPQPIIKSNKSDVSVSPVFYTIDNYFDATYVINLKKRTDRWKSVQRRLDAVGITKYQRYDAYNGDILSPLVDKQILVRRTGGYLGCLLSHLDIIWQAREAGLENVLILEDDIKVYNKLIPAFNDIIQDLHKHYPNGYDVLYLGHYTFDGHYSIEEDFTRGGIKYNCTIEKYDKCVVQAHNSWAMHAYAVHSRFYDIILNRYKDVFDLELDRWMMDDIQNKNRNIYTTLIAYPQLFIQEWNYSDNIGAMGAKPDNFIYTQYSKLEEYI